MPVLHIDLAADQYSDAQHRELLVQCSRFYAEALNSPIDRVRVFIHLYPRRLVAIAGVPSDEDDARAPHFRFLVLEGRSLEERHRLLTGFTDIIECVLGVERALIRGGCWPISPENWAIGGVPASVKRASELQARTERPAYALLKDPSMNR